VTIKLRLPAGWGKLPHVRLRLIRWDSRQLRALAAAVLFCAVGLAVALSAAPQLHDWLHKSGDRTTHECAATLMSSGSAEQSACEPVLKQPQPAPAVPAFRVQPFARVLAVLGSSLLEHAPPAQS
jgi:hypothetical protein